MENFFNRKFMSALHPQICYAKKQRRNKVNNGREVDDNRIKISNEGS